MSGNLERSAARVLRQLMVDQGLGCLYSTGGDWPIWVNETRDLPDEAIFLRDTVGNKFSKFMTDGEVQENPGVQITVRSSGENTGNAKASTVMTTLDPLANQTVSIDDDEGTGSSEYIVHAISRSGGVNAIGTEEPQSMRYLFTINVTLAIYQTA